MYKYGDKYVLVTEDVMKIFDKYKQYDHKQHESGGILLGKVYNDLIIIDKISEPSKEDKSGRYYFVRNVKRAQNIVEKAWKESNGERIYLGEWHTHPEDIPTPSKDDKILLNNMLKHSRMDIDFLFMVIIGRNSPYFAVLHKGLKEMIPLERINSASGLNIIIYKNQNKQIYGFQVSGYLNLAKKGYDIYNAAFSQIFWGTINSLIELTGIHSEILEIAPAFIRFIVPDTEIADEKVKTLLDSMEVQVEMVIEEMKSKGLENHIHVEIKG